MTVTLIMQLSFLVVANAVVDVGATYGFTEIAVQAVVARTDYCTIPKQAKELNTIKTDFCARLASLTSQPAELKKFLNYIILELALYKHYDYREFTSLSPKTFLVELTRNEKRREDLAKWILHKICGVEPTGAALLTTLAQWVRDAITMELSDSESSSSSEGETTFAKNARNRKRRLSKAESDSLVSSSASDSDSSSDGSNSPNSEGCPANPNKKAKH